MARKKPAAKKKAPAKKAPAKKKAAPAKKKAAPAKKKASAKKTAAKKTAAKKTAAKNKSAAKKTASKKAAPKKTAGKKAAAAESPKTKSTSGEAPDHGDGETVSISSRPAAIPRAGMRAPNFVLRSDEGKEISLSSLQGKKVVLYFYPKDDTPGCTTEACGFRDLHKQIQKAGAVVIGVSKDSVKKHQNFKTKYKLPFTLLADEEGEVIQAYGSWGVKKFMGRTFDGILRTTVLIDAEGMIAKVYNKVAVKEHAAAVLKDLENI